MKKCCLHLSRLALLLVLPLLLSTPSASAQELPDGFVRVREVIPAAVQDVRYFTARNFVGQRIDGYVAPEVILTTQATNALAKVQAELKPFGLGLKIFDGYRPQSAVDHFVRWAKDTTDTRTKLEYYPEVDKKHLFRDGYIAAQSGHSRGSTVDVTIIGLDTGLELDMGTTFDHFGKESWPGNEMMPVHVRANRMLLRTIMVENGFKPLREEWWHFTLKDEPHPSTYFDFAVQ